MSKKTELINIFTGYKRQYETIQAQAAEINKNPAYTVVGREEAIKALTENFAPMAKQYHDKAIEAISTALDAMAAKWRKESAGRLLDGGYQSGLSNVAKMLEMGVVREKEDIQNIIDTYSGDFNVLSMIRKILQNSSDEMLREYAFLVPEDNRDKNKQLLAQLKRNVDANLCAPMAGDLSMQSPVNSILLSIDGMVQFVRDRLGDNLDLLD